MNKRILLISALLFIPLFAEAQTLPDSLAGTYFFDTDTGEDLSTFYDRLAGFYKNPIDVNNCTVSDLMQLPFLDYKTAARIIDYKKERGRLLSKTELYGIEEIDKNCLNNIMPYIYASPAELNLQQMPDTSGSLSLYNAFQNKFYTEPSSAGISSLKIINRMEIKPAVPFALNYIQAKDAGEKFGDFTSYSLSYTSKGFFQKVIAGDYRIEAGRRLLFSGSPYISKYLLTSINNNGFDINAQNSADPNNYLRGAAVVMREGNFSFSGFYSYRNYDAETDISTGEIKSILKSGLHRTNNEIDNRDRLRENLAGTNLDFRYDRIIHCGITYYHSSYNIPIASQGSIFNGLSGYYNFFQKRLKLFGEYALIRKYPAAYTGMEYLLTDEIKYAITYRNYSAGFYSPHGNPLKQSFDNGDKEKGLINSLTFKNKTTSLNLVYDQYSVANTLPANAKNYNGTDIRLYFGYIISRVLSLEGKISYADNDSPDTAVKENKTTYRADALVVPFPRLGLRYRIEYSRKSGNDIITNGYTCFQDISYKLKSGFKLYFRLIYFYKSSYEYENDVQDIFTNQYLSGEGYRWYAGFHYNFTHLAGISGKYSYEMNNLFPEKARSILNLQLNLFL
jgi:hypothetical protein